MSDPTNEPPDSNELSPSPTQVEEPEQPEETGKRARAGRGRADEALAAELAAGKTVREAAEAAGVAESTVYRRLNDDKFNERVKQLRAGFVADAAGRLASTMVKAANTLRDLLDSRNENIKLRAAAELLSSALQLVELEDLQRRVEELEMRAAERERADQ